MSRKQQRATVEIVFCVRVIFDEIMTSILEPGKDLRMFTISSVRVANDDSVAWFFVCRKALPCLRHFDFFDTPLWIVTLREMLISAT